EKAVVQALVRGKRLRSRGEFRSQAEGPQSQWAGPQEHLEHEKPRVQERDQRCRYLGGDFHGDPSMHEYRRVDSAVVSERKEGPAMPVNKTLIVDDSAPDRQFLVETLSKQGYQCTTAQNGDEGIAKSKTDMPDLILMDIIMPGTDGFKAT